MERLNVLTMAVRDGLSIVINVIISILLFRNFGAVEVGIYALIRTTTAALECFLRLPSDRLVPRAIAARDTRGFIKLLRKTGTQELIGARIIAPEGSELLMELSLMMKYKIPISDIAKELHPYLTLSEGIKLAAQTFDKDVKSLSCCAS